MITNIGIYSDGTQTSYPLRESDGFTFEVYIHMSISPYPTAVWKKLRTMTEMDIQWRKTDLEGYAGANGTDTRIFTGMKITDGSAVKFLEKLGAKHMPYMLSNDNKTT